MEGAGLTHWVREIAVQSILYIANELKIQSGGFGADTVSTGNGGTIEIDAKILDMSFGCIGVNTRNVGKGGQIKIKAETIFLRMRG